MTPSPMIERISAAVHEAANREAGQDEYCSYAMAEAAARAALTVLNEPDEAMRRAGGEYISEGTSMQCKQMIAETIWRVMVGAALRGEG